MIEMGNIVSLVMVVRGKKQHNESHEKPRLSGKIKI